MSRPIAGSEFFSSELFTPLCRPVATIAFLRCVTAPRSPCIHRPLENVERENAPRAHFDPDYRTSSSSVVIALLVHQFRIVEYCATAVAVRCALITAMQPILARYVTTWISVCVTPNPRFTRLAFARPPVLSSAPALLPYIKRNDASRLLASGIGLGACVCTSSPAAPFAARIDRGSTDEAIPLSPQDSPGDHFALKERAVSSRTSEIHGSLHLAEVSSGMADAANGVCTAYHVSDAAVLAVYIRYPGITRRRQHIT